jgi:ABC-type transporter lipoprotein component MlaA/pimeloyl-ACP methyl ester carboxylesterase
VTTVLHLAPLFLWLCFDSFAHGQQPPGGFTNAPTQESFTLPGSVPDPLEAVNRVVWSFNKGLMTRVVQPTSRVYRFVVVKPVRTGLGNLGRNLTFPGRLINNLLQGKWTGARDESCRFLLNSTLGIGGVLDLATRHKIPKSDADFGQTFGKWGWEPLCFLMLPILGPMNDRDALGFAADTAANPLLYVAPYDFNASKPLSWLGSYTYFTYAVTYNSLSDSVGEYVRFSQATMDPYGAIQYARTFARANRVADFKVKGETDEASLETLASVFFTNKDPEFPGSGKTRSVWIPATRRSLKFTYWLRPGNAPVVYILPGMGSHRMAHSSLALAELAYQNGFSSVCISSAFNAEFMETAATAAMPAYLPADGHDVHAALTEVDRRLETLHPRRLGKKALMGYSMGALHSLYIAANSPPDSPLSDNRAATLPRLLRFDRYVAINTPVRLIHGMSTLDDFYHAPLGWPAASRTDNIANTFLKVAALSKSTLTPHTTLPFSAIESRFLIGLAFRFTLRDMIFTSQRRTSQRVLKHSVWALRRAPAYEEILKLSYRDYFEKFVIPYYQTDGTAAIPSGTLEKAGDLRTYAAALRERADIRVVVNQNDFLLADEDLAWLRATFAPEQLTVFGQGGHLGNLIDPVVQRSIVEALQGLSVPGPGPH